MRSPTGAPQPLHAALADAKHTGYGSKKPATPRKRRDRRGVLSLLTEHQDPGRQGQCRARHADVRHDCRAAVQGLRCRLRRGQQAAGPDGLQHRPAPDRGLPGEVQHDEALRKLPRDGRDDRKGNPAIGRWTRRDPLAD